MKNKFLTKKRKAYYHKDFEKILTCNNGDGLDDDIKEYLVEINKNPDIQTLFSSRDDLERSSIRFAYSKNIEGTIFKKIIPIIICRCSVLKKSSLCYNFSYAKKNLNYNLNSDLGWLNNKNYFLNYIELNLKSDQKEAHDNFWIIIQDILATA